MMPAVSSPPASINAHNKCPSSSIYSQKYTEYLTLLPVDFKALEYIQIASNFLRFWIHFCAKPPILEERMAVRNS